MAILLFSTLCMQIRLWKYLYQRCKMQSLHAIRNPHFCMKMQLWKKTDTHVYICLYKLFFHFHSSVGDHAGRYVCKLCSIRSIILIFSYIAHTYTHLSTYATNLCRLWSVVWHGVAMPSLAVLRFTMMVNLPRHRWPCGEVIPTMVHDGSLVNFWGV